MVVFSPMFDGCVFPLLRSCVPTSSSVPHCAVGTAGNPDGGLCSAGFYCPAGSTNSTAIPCGNVTVYCPGLNLPATQVSSAFPVSVPVGSYSLPEDSALNATRSGVKVCEQGYRCNG